MPESPFERELDPPTSIVEAALDAAVDELVGGPGSGSPGEREQALMPAMNVVCERLGVHLTRWVGAEGWKALLRRGLDEVRGGGAAALALSAAGELRWSDAATLADARTSCVRMLVAVTGVLARFIGDDMALRLIEQGVAPGDSESGQGPDHG